ncbi:MAG: hypothetical protein ACREPI_01705 [Candidatus Dormibacterales bacterium]
MQRPGTTARSERWLNNGIYLIAVAAALGLLALAAWSILAQHDYGPGFIALFGSLALLTAYLVDRTGRGSFLD